MNRRVLAFLVALLFAAGATTLVSRAEESAVERNLKAIPPEEDAPPEQAEPEPDPAPVAPTAQRRGARTVSVPLPPTRPAPLAGDTTAPATPPGRAATWSDLAPGPDGVAKATAELPPAPPPEAPAATASLPPTPSALPLRNAPADPAAQSGDMPEGAPSPSIGPEEDEDAHIGPDMEKQIESVSVECLKPELVKLIKDTAAFFGKVPIITSGYRARGRRGSYHRRCMAADFFIPGVPTQTLTGFLRALPGAGGVGTYCGTKLVHLDIGEPRNWGYCGLRRTYFAVR